MAEYILFDLDGTLTDPFEGITKSVAYSLSYFGIYAEKLENLKPFIGPPLAYSFSYFCDMNEEDTKYAVEKYRERYAEYGWAENVPYAGIADALDRLQKAGKHLLVATCKAEEYAVKIMEHFDLAKYFDHICGSPMSNPNTSKDAVIRDAMKRAGVTDKTKVIMVGDRLHDIEGAHSVGIPAVGVLWGYGDRAEHEKCGADHIVSDIPEMERLLLGIH